MQLSWDDSAVTHTGGGLWGVRSTGKAQGIPLAWVDAFSLGDDDPPLAAAGLSGDLSFALAALIGAVSGLLIAPVTTIYYDTGFLIGLKGFVAAIVGGLSSYPLALAGALLVGQLESFSSFWASAFKEVIVFTLIIPVLWWRSLNTHHVEDEE